MRFSVLAAALSIPLALAGCGQEKELYVDGGWVSLPARTGAPGAAYFTIHGGPNDDVLLRVSSEITFKTEIHESGKSADGMMKMTPLQSVPIPADGKVEFAPGGKHVMLFNMRTLKPGQTMRLDFTFASGEQIYIDAPAYPAGSGGADHKSGH
jgi:copper(I)-binding protein